MLTSYFLRGYFGGRDLGDMSKLLKDVLRICRVPESQITDAIDGILKIGDKWGLEMSRYGRRRALDVPTCPGHILQIFVHSSVVDSVAYGALPLGRPARGGVPISGWLTRQCPLDGQARLLVHPGLFM